MSLVHDILSFALQGPLPNRGLIQGGEKPQKLLHLSLAFPSKKLGAESLETMSASTGGKDSEL